MVNRFEQITLSVTRWILILTVAITTLLMLLLFLYIGVDNIRSQQNKDQDDGRILPEISRVFEAPELSPVEEFAQREKAAQCQESYQSKIDDANTQLELTSKNARKSSREIKNRYAELLAKEDNSPREISKLIKDQQAEAEENCNNSQKAQSEILAGLDDDAKQLSERFGVEVSSCAINEFENLYPLPTECKDQKEVIDVVASNLREAYPSDCGLNGRGSKFGIYDTLVRIYDNVEEATSSDYVNYYFENLAPYTNDLKNYFSEQQDQLESANQLNSDSVDILCDDLTEYIANDIDMAISSYDAAKLQKALALEEVDSAFSEMIATYSGWILPFFLIFLISISLLIAYFAFERHLRK
tara:strand:+ start:98 stop:1168 length:1071 start_codon:yes stop_codon:yes gene_type:complete